MITIAEVILVQIWGVILLKYFMDSYYRKENKRLQAKVKELETEVECLKRAL